jgi:hypothetical protein
MHGCDRTDRDLLEQQLPICYRTNDLSDLLNLASCCLGQRGEQVLRWHRSLTEAERALLRQHFVQIGYVVQWTNRDELRVSNSNCSVGWR